jgi:hypothetical protein
MLDAEVKAKKGTKHGGNDKCKQNKPHWCDDDGGSMKDEW